MPVNRVPRRENRARRVGDPWRSVSAMLPTVTGEELRRDPCQPWRQESIVPYDPAAGRVAVFLDFENLVSGLPGRKEPIPATALAWLCRGFGDASIRRAYANWANPGIGRYQEALATNGVDLIQISRCGKHKNAADIRMTVDAMETLITHPDVGVFVLASGDSDYTPLVTRLREHGKQVIGVGTEANASDRLVSICTAYKFWSTLVDEVDPETTIVPAKCRDIAAVEQLVLRAFERIRSDTPTASAIKSAMRALDPSFDESNYGCTRFRGFLARLPHRVRTVGTSGLDITVGLVPDAPTATTPS